MKKVFLIIILLVFCTGNIFAQTVVLKSISSGEYEDGKFTYRNDSFEGEYYIDRQTRTVKLTKIIKMGMP